MKKTSKMIRTGLLALLLSATATVFGQVTGTGTISKPPLGVGPSTTPNDPGRIEALGSLLNSAYEEANVVLFFKPETNGPSLNLVASRIEDLTDVATSRTTALEFTHYEWTYMGRNGTTAVDGEAFSPGLISEGLLVTYSSPGDNTLPLSELSPGYHYFNVQGYILPEGTAMDETCEPQYTETFVVFVLPPLKVTTTPEENDLLQYCELDASGQTAIGFAASVAYDGFTESPALSEFELRYTWYSVQADAEGNYPIIDDSKVDITGAFSRQAMEVKDVSNNYTPKIDVIGRYKFFVEVEYTIKARDYDEAETPTARERTYALFRSWVGGANQANALELVVTPAPGKPHITIEGVND